MSKSTHRVKLNLGCGFDKRPGYVNLDVDPRVKPDKVHDLLDPLPYPANSVSEIVLQDVLEHFTKEDGEKLLKECLRALQPGGSLHVRVPNPQAIVRKFYFEVDLMMLYLYGDTTQNGVWGAHKYGYHSSLLEEIGQQLGFTILSAQAADTNWIFELHKIQPDQSQKRPLSTENVKTIGRVPDWFVAELVQLGGNWVVLTNVSQQLIATIPLWLARQKVAWFIHTPAPTILAKSVLRKLSKLVRRIGFDEKDYQPYLTHTLQYSHLRILDGSKTKKSSRT